MFLLICGCFVVVELTRGIFEDEDLDASSDTCSLIIIFLYLVCMNKRTVLCQVLPVFRIVLMDTGTG